MFKNKIFNLTHWVASIQPHWKGVIVTAAIALLAPLLMLSESTYKSIIDRWIQDCRIVIEKKYIDASENTPQIVEVELYAGGKTPKEITIVFSTEKKVIKQVRFERKITEQKLIVHPLAGGVCPGGIICVGIVDPKELYSDIRIKLTDFYPNFRYYFKVTMQPEYVNEQYLLNNLDVYVHYKEKLSENDIPLCRVEGASLFNLYFRSSDWMKFTLTALLLCALTAVVAVLKIKGK